MFCHGKKIEMSWKAKPSMNWSVSIPQGQRARPESAPAEKSSPRVCGLILGERQTSQTSEGHETAFWGGTSHPADPEADSGNAERVTHPCPPPEELSILAVVEKLVRVSLLPAEPHEQDGTEGKKTHRAF